MMGMHMIIGIAKPISDSYKEIASSVVKSSEEHYNLLVSEYYLHMVSPSL